MNEKEQGQKRISRRQFLKLVTPGAVAVGADYILKDGRMVNPSALKPYPERVNLEPLNNGQVNDPLHINNNTFVYYNSDGHLIIQHENARFDPDRDYNISHRGGNKKSAVDKAISLGADGFDIDANDAGHKHILAEHGIVMRAKIPKISAALVLDAGQGKLGTRLSNSIASIFDYIGIRNNPDDPFVAQIELKRGPFDNYESLMDVVVAISRNDIPTRIFSNHQERIDNFYSAMLEHVESFDNV